MLIAIVLLLLNTDYIQCVVNNKPQSKLEIPKCCADNQAVYMHPKDFFTSCKNFSSEFIVENVTIYDRVIHDQPVLKSFYDIFRVEVDKRPDEELLIGYAPSSLISEPFLSEDGLLYLHYPNSYVRWNTVNSTFYCIDYEVRNVGNSSELALVKNASFWCGYFGEQPKETSSIFTAALFVSVVFLALVLIVYILLPGLRNLGGKVLMAYVCSLLLAFLFLAIIQTFDLYPEACVGFTTAVYFFFLASFCWMTVMSYDIWWTFRGYAKARPIHRRGETFKFLMYCIYGFGVPLAMSIAFVVINSTDLTSMPWFVKPQIPQMGCFIEGGQKLVYLYAPMLILILCNWMFFLMTAFNIWRLHRGTAVLDSPAAGTPQAHRNQRNRFFIYLKLSIIMGINWLLEVVSSLTPEFQFWYISDTYNLLIGLAIFLIFVCKKKIYRDLRSRFNKSRLPTRFLTKSQTSSTTLSTTSQDTPLQVFHHPNGTSVRR